MFHSPPVKLWLHNSHIMKVLYSTYPIGCHPGVLPVLNESLHFHRNNLLSILNVNVPGVIKEVFRRQWVQFVHLIVLLIE